MSQITPPIDFPMVLIKH